MKLSKGFGRVVVGRKFVEYKRNLRKEKKKWNLCGRVVVVWCSKELWRKLKYYLYLFVGWFYFKKEEVINVF